MILFQPWFYHDKPEATGEVVLGDLSTVVKNGTLKSLFISDSTTCYRNRWMSEQVN
jgi:hypothetical protein